MISSMGPIWKYVTTSKELMLNHPPEISHRNKQIVFDLACPPGTIHEGEVTFSRWEQLELPDRVARHSERPQFELREEYFTYDSPPDGQFEWHLNFAHHDLFCCYSGPLFAQDEMQVAEHPALAAVRNAIIAAGLKPYTVEQDDVTPDRDRATPILITGVERRCRIATDPNPSASRPHGLYGNRFATADEEAIRQATEVLDPPTISNIIAIEAPACRHGKYTRAQIESILATAYTGFQVAHFEAVHRQSSPPRVAIHTGYWGCGAYGGNRELMPLLQMIAACSSGIDSMVFHTGGDPHGYQQAERMLAELLPSGSEIELSVMLDAIEDQGYEWGVSDGN